MRLHCFYQHTPELTFQFKYQTSLIGSEEQMCGSFSKVCVAGIHELRFLPVPRRFAALLCQLASEACRAASTMLRFTCKSWTALRLSHASAVHSHITRRWSYVIAFISDARCRCGPSGGPLSPLPTFHLRRGCRRSSRSDRRGVPEISTGLLSRVGGAVH